MSVILCSGSCEHGKFIGECDECMVVEEPTASVFPNIEDLREAVGSEGRVVDQLCDSFSNHTWVRLNLVNPIRRAFGAARWLLSLLDEGGRLVVETPCEHGNLVEHSTCGRGKPHDPDNFSCVCPGGSRHVVWPREEEGQ